MRKIRGARSVFEAILLDQAHPLTIKKPEDWKFHEGLVFNAEYDGKWKGCTFFPAIVREWSKGDTAQMIARWMAMEEHWRRMSVGVSYLVEQYYTPDGERLKRREDGELNQVIADAMQEHGRLIVILFAFLDEKKHHCFNAKSLKLAYKRYGHLFTEEFIDLAKQQQRDKKSKVNIFEQP